MTTQDASKSLEDRLQFLVNQGFTDYQARAYLALLEYSSCTVGELARAAGLPRNRLYEVLSDLESMGLVQVRPETPRRYRARPLGEYLKVRADALRAEARSLENDLDGIHDFFAPPPEEAHAPTVGTTRVLQGRRAVAREVERIFTQAEDHLLITISTGSLDRVLGYVRHGLDRRMAGGLPAVRLSAIVPVNAGGTAHMTEAEDLFSDGISLIDANLRLTGFARDDAELLLVQAIPEDARLRTGEDFALLTTNPAILHDHRAFLQLVGHHTTHPS